MISFKRSAARVFASESVLGHLLRGVIATSLLVWAIRHQSEPMLSLGAGVAALIVFRGCPICWTVGLVETVLQRMRRSSDTVVE